MESDYLQLRDFHTFDLHLKFFGRDNLSLGYTAWSALTHYYCELDQTASLGDRATEVVYLVGLRLEANRLHDWFLNSQLGLFNRLYTECFLTVYQSLDLNTFEATATLALKSHWSYASWTVRTCHFYKHAQLLWDGVPPTPTWMPAATEWQNRTDSTAADPEQTGTGSVSSSSGSGKLANLLKLMSELIKD